MRIREQVLSALMLLTCSVQICAEESPAVQPRRVVGSVYGKVVTAADVGLTAPIDPAVQFDSRDQARWELMQRIVKTFGMPIVDRFVKQQKIEATADEIEAFKASTRERNERALREGEDRLAEVKAALATSDPTDEERGKLQEEQQMLERSLSARRDGANVDSPEVARHFIVAWKTERELHRAYGGRVIFQQFGPEALDARRRLFEKAEKNGDLKLDDAGVRCMFYYYANMKHIVGDAKVLEHPWFLGKAR